MIEERDAFILWDTNQDGLVTEVVVLSRATYLADPAMRAEMRRLPKSAGACTIDWLEAEDEPLTNAASWFAQMLVNPGFTTFGSYTAALREFAKINTAGWARQQLAHALWLDDRRENRVPWPPGSRPEKVGAG